MTIGVTRVEASLSMIYDGRILVKAGVGYDE
jgi:hypothetical protein